MSEDDFDTSYQLDVSLFQEKLGDCFQVISKDHVYLHSDASKVKSLPDAETQELLLIADLVVSDYSSIIFDAMSINIPVLLYCNDFDRFESSRGVYPEVWSLIDERVETSLDGLARRILKMEAEGLLDMEKYPTRKDQSDRSKAAETLIKLAEGAERAAYKVIHFHANCDIDDQKAVKAIVSNIGKNRGSHIIAVLHDFESEFVSLLETVYLHNEKIVVVSSESQLAADLLTSIVIADEIDVNLSEIKKEI